jgi:gluconate kinase
VPDLYATSRYEEASREAAMTDDDRIWLTAVADALDKAQRHTQIDHGESLVTIAISDALARGVADRLRAIAEGA